MKFFGWGLTFLGLLSVLGCTPPNNPVPPVPQSMTTLDSTDSTHWWSVSPETDLDKTRVVSIRTALPSAGRVYYLLTNTSSNPSAKSSLTASVEVARSSMAIPGKVSSDPATGRVELSDRIGSGQLYPKIATSRSRSALGSAIPPPPSYSGESLGAVDTFIDANWYTSATAVPGAANRHPSTLRSKTTVAGRTLNIWVADDCWSIDGTSLVASEPDSASGANATAITTAWNQPDHLVTQAMVTAMQQKFLNNGTSDIYGYEHVLFGAEWPDISSPPTYVGYPMIDGGSTIDIFVANLNVGATKSGGLMGYFHALNNYTNADLGVTAAQISANPVVRQSNERVLFAIDARNLADPSPDGVATDLAANWDVTDYWPAETMSTLAHEFQHMIHFYQKQVKQNLNADTDTWINEMASLMVEDLLSDKLGTPGPRGVTGTDFTTGSVANLNGRLPDFNYWHESISLTGWGTGIRSSKYDSYANAYAFGAWLLRNYGGATLLNDLVTNSYTDYRAVEHAVGVNGAGVGQTFASLVRDWGLATFLKSSSTRTGLKYHAASGIDYSADQFQWTYGSQTYSAGSIDLGNYRYVEHDQYGNQTGTWDGPYYYGSIAAPYNNVYSGATFIFQKSANAAGTFSDSVALPPSVVLTLVFAP